MTESFLAFSVFPNQTGFELVIPNSTPGFFRLASKPQNTNSKSEMSLSSQGAMSNHLKNNFRATCLQICLTVTMNTRKGGNKN